MLINAISGFFEHNVVCITSVSVWECRYSNASIFCSVPSILNTSAGINFRLTFCSIIAVKDWLHLTRKQWWAALSLTLPFPLWKKQLGFVQLVSRVSLKTREFLCVLTPGICVTSISYQYYIFYMQPKTIPFHLTRPRRASRLDPRDLKVLSKVDAYVLLRGNVYMQNSNLDFIWVLRAEVLVVSHL